MAPPKKTTKTAAKTTTESSVTADAVVAAADEPEEPKDKKEKLSISVHQPGIPVESEPHVNFQFTVEVDGLDPLQTADLISTSPTGIVKNASVTASPQGVAQFLLMATEEGKHELEASAEGKRKAKEKVDVQP